MAIEYKIQIIPTLDKEKAKQLADKLKSLFTKSKVDIDMSPMVETVL